MKSLLIPSKTWQNYIKKLAKIDTKAAADVVAYMTSHDAGTETGAKALVDYAYAVSTKYGEAAAELTCQMYDAIAYVSKAAVPAAEPAATATYGEIAKTVYGTLASTKDPDAVGAAVGRTVKLASVDTLQQNALRDGAEWAWIPSGDSCAYCMMLASRGWVKASAKAIKNGHAEHVHNNCDCTYCVRFDRETTVEGYDPDSLYDEYINAGDTPRERLNALRRQYYAENKDYINAQKRAAYARRRLGNSFSGLERPDITSFPDRIPINSKEDIETILQKMDFPKDDKELVEYISHSIQQIPKEDFELLDKYGITIIRSNENLFMAEPIIGENGRLTYRMHIDPNSNLEYGFAHEYVHFAYEVNDLPNDEEFVSVVTNFADSITDIKGAAIKGTNDIHSVVESPLAIDVYQGRTYIDFGAYEPVQDICIGDLVEYMPTGYEYYLGEPELLEKTDPMLYNYFTKRGLR